jgi:hypothetical protein
MVIFSQLFFTSINNTSWKGFDMIRLVLGVVVGYVAIFLIVMVSFSVAYLTLGSERSFQPGTFDVSFIWVIISLVLGFIAAVVGGFICHLIAQNPKASIFLAGLVLVLGLLLAIPTLSQSGDQGSNVRSGDISNFEAMQQANQPAWMALINPFLGAVGVILGARIRISG